MAGRVSCDSGSIGGNGKYCVRVGKSRIFLCGRGVFVVLLPVSQLQPMLSQSLFQLPRFVRCLMFVLQILSFP